MALNIPSGVVTVRDCQKLGGCSQKRDLGTFRAPLFLGNWCRVTTYFFYKKNKKKKLKTKYMTELFPFIDWVKKYIFEKLKITWLFVLVTNYPKKKKKQTKIRPRSTYPKTLNSEAKLQNGNVLGTYFTQTKSGLLDSHDLYICCT